MSQVINQAENNATYERIFQVNSVEDIRILASIGHEPNRTTCILMAKTSSATSYHCKRITYIPSEMRETTGCGFTTTYSSIKYIFSGALKYANHYMERLRNNRIAKY